MTFFIALAAVLLVTAAILLVLWVIDWLLP